MGKELTWSYGVTTVPKRIESGLTEQTLASLNEAGFPEPRIFIDGKGSLPNYEVTVHDPPLKAFGKWVVSLWELYVRYPLCDRYAIFQDDFVTYKNLRKYLNKLTYPDKGYLNLYTFSQNHPNQLRLDLPNGYTGFYPSNQLGKGAVALVFNRKAVMALLGSEHMSERPTDSTRGHRFIDGGVVTALKQKGFKEYVHMPSLVQHTGDVSAIGNRPHEKAPSFRGENFDALELLEGKSNQTKVGNECMEDAKSVPIKASLSKQGKGLGDKVEQALTFVGITSERVEKILGRKCGCKERKEKLNRLGDWAARVLTGKDTKQQSLEHLEGAIEGLVGASEESALNTLLAPSDRRRGKQGQGVMQIWVTRACDKACFGCTQGSNLAGKPGMITVDQFEEAVLSLKDYFGVVGVFGGNPCMHPHFDKLCEVLRKHVDRGKCGLWSNNLLGKGEHARKTFSPRCSNLNVHQDRKAYDEMKRDWPECKPFGLGEDSRHSPVYTALKDLVPDEEERWKLISKCDINRHWSAMIGVFRGELRGWFCEIAGSQSMLHQHEEDYPDTGIPIESGQTYRRADGAEVDSWWKLDMGAFAHQARKHCHECGVPFKGYGELANASDTEGTEQVTKTHEGIYNPKRKGRLVQLVTNVAEIAPDSLNKFTAYLPNAKK